MLLKNVASQGVFLYDYTISTGVAKTGDASNITGYWSLDGGTATVFGTANPTEVSSSHMPGVYWQPLAQGETNGNAIAYCWASSTSGCAIQPLTVLTTGAGLPNSDILAAILAKALSSPRAIDSVADGSLLVSDALWAALCWAAGQVSASGTSLTIKTPSTHTTIRTQTLDSSTQPTQRT